jgi:transcriptional regulator GlxA family with amidase domain
MLAPTALPLAQIAHACGFSSPETLRQAFVAGYRITPSLFRATQSAAEKSDRSPRKSDTSERLP